MNESADIPPPDHAWRLGTIGFSYADWVGPFYPKGADAFHKLTRYAAVFDSVEIDTTFYSLPTLEMIKRWNDVTPSHFRFCLKTPKLVTHGSSPGPIESPTPDAHLTDAATLDTMKRFLDTASSLADKLAVVLIQFPTPFGLGRIDELAQFLSRLPRAMRYAVEFRHDSWWQPRTAEVLRSLNVAWVCADQVTREHAAEVPTRDSPSLSRPRAIISTADFLYVRWMGRHSQYAEESHEQVDPTPRVAWWVNRLNKSLAKLPEVRRTYAFFGNGFAGYAPATARRFASMMHIPLPEPPTVHVEPSLFSRETDKEPRP